MPCSIPSAPPPSYDSTFVKSSPAISRGVWDILPTEILQQIFIYASPCYYHDPELVEVRISQATIVSCTRVCLAWRAAAFSRRELWACMVDVQRQSASYLRHLLETSAPHHFNVGHRSAPISFWGSETDGRKWYHIPEILGLLVEHQARIREFHVVWSEYGGVGTILNRKDVLALAELQMPCLESLSWSRALTSRFPRPIPRNQMTVPHTLVAQPCSRLPRLTKVLAQCTDLPLSMRLPSLTELTLISPPHRPTCLELIRFLQTTPWMRFLHFNDAVDPGGLTLLSVSSLPCANLPHLTLLAIEGKEIEQVAGMVQILKSLPLETSEACGFQIICPSIPRYPPHLLSCLDYVGTQIDRCIKNALLTNTTDLPLQLISDPTTGDFVLSTILHSDPSHTLDFASNGSGRVVEALKLLGGRAWALQTRGVGAEATVMLMGSVNPIVTSLRVRVLKLHRLASPITNLDINKKAALGKGVCALLRLTSITLDQRAATLVLPLLVSDPTARDPWALPLPRLKSIILESCDCTPFSKLFRTLESLLEERAALDNPIIQVTFIRSSVSMDEVLDLGRKLWCYMAFEPDHTSGQGGSHSGARYKNVLHATYGM